MLKNINRVQLHAALGATPRPILVEALPRKYFDDGHLPGTRHMPHDQVRALAPPCCRTCMPKSWSMCQRHLPELAHRCAGAATDGYTNVAVYAGGKKDWSEAGLPLERAPWRKRHRTARQAKCLGSRAEIRKPNPYQQTAAPGGSSRSTRAPSPSAIFRARSRDPGRCRCRSRGSGAIKALEHAVGVHPMQYLARCLRLSNTACRDRCMSAL